MSQSRKQSQSQPQSPDGKIAMMFYKKTAIPIPVTDSKEFYKSIMEQTEDEIKKNMRRGLKIKDMIKGCFEENDKILKVVEKIIPTIMSLDDYCLKLSCLAKELGIEDDDKVTSGKFVMIHWYINTCVLIRLRALENNDDNGWLIIEKNDNIAKIVTF